MYEYHRKGRHLTTDDRAMIERLVRTGHTQTQIAALVGVSQSTICRELKKGRTQQLDGSTWLYNYTYTADKGQTYADYQKTAHGRGLKIGNNFKYLQALDDKIRDGHSPYSAIYAVAQTNAFDVHVSKTTLYRYIQEGLLPTVRYKHLPVGHPKKRKGTVAPMRTKNAARRSIERRAPEIARRDTVGHWEQDSIIGKSEGQGESCLVLTERKTRMEIVIKQPDKTAKATVDALQGLKSYFGVDFCKMFKTISNDNGSEFADQEGMDATGTTVFYCHPQAPHERGSNENANKLLRRKFPKGESMSAKTQEDATQAMHFVNHYHREMFHGETAAQRMAREIPAMGLEYPERVYRFFGIDPQGI